ncbi:hypothetical protein DBR47_00565 [Paucibacter sp. KBW04]|nr:hypothetical protein DBR47_00565 [Paucibacter sp. KBW04]
MSRRIPDQLLAQSPALNLSRNPLHTLQMVSPSCLLLLQSMHRSQAKPGMPRKRPMTSLSP